MQESERVKERKSIKGRERILDKDLKREYKREYDIYIYIQV